jgi:hypothetical protein
MATSKNNKYVLFIFLLLISYSLFSQNLLIRGVVSDTIHTPIQDVSIVIYSKDKVITYSFTDAEGKYSLVIDKGLPEVKFVANILGFKSYEKIIDAKVKGDLELNVFLEPQVETLNEVVLESWEKIKVKRDTITFKVSEFTDKTESVVEDLLKNLPGVEISTEGVIKVNGQAIDKLLVEGDDMFGSKYKLLSKNLDANAIDQVQILNNFEDNPVLKSFQESKKVALNLILKEDKKNVWFGNVELGLGTNGQNNHSANIGLIRKDIKFFDFINTNDIGNSANAQIKSSSVIEISNIDEARLEQKNAYAPVNVDNLPNSLFTNGEDIFNDSFINSLSALKKLGKNTQLRNLTYYAYDDVNKTNTNQTDFFLNPETISFFEQNQVHIINNYYATQFELRHANQSSLFLNFNTQFENIPGRKRNNLVFDDEQITQKQFDNSINFFNRLNLTKKLSQNKLLSMLAYYGSNDTEQSLNIKPNVFSDIFNNDSNQEIHQNSKSPQVYYGASAEVFTKVRKSQFSLKFSANVTDDDLKSDFRFLQSASIDTLSNNTRFTHAKVGLTSKYNLDLAKGFTLITTFDFFQNRLELNQQNRHFSLLDINVGLHSKKTPLGNFGVNYNFTNNLPSINDLNENFFLTNYRFFSKGTNQIENFKTHSFSFFYTYNDYKKQFLINSFLTYSFFNNTYGNISTVDERTNFNSRMILGGGETTNFIFSVNRYIRAFETSVKLSTQHLWFNNQTVVNEQLGNLSNYNGNVKLQGTTYFGIPLNFKFYALINYSEGEFQNRASTTNYKEGSLQAILKLSNEWFVDFNTRYYDFESSSFTFSNFTAHYTPADSRWSFKATANNIWNVKRFSNISISDFQRNELFAQTIQRYFMFNLKYRF